MKVTKITRVAAIALTNSLLATDEGITGEQYRRLLELLSCVLTLSKVADLKKAVRATDGRFYLPKGMTLDGLGRCQR
jgi:hypothetical protein